VQRGVTARRGVPIIPMTLTGMAIPAIAGLLVPQ
jgi:hypothetical protein